MLVLIFEAVLRMSIYGLVAACLAALAGMAVRRLPVSRSVVLVLWAAAAVRLVCPVAIPVPGGIFSGFDRAVDQGFAFIGLSGTGRIAGIDGVERKNGSRLAGRQAAPGQDGTHGDGAPSPTQGAGESAVSPGGGLTDGNDPAESETVITEAHSGLMGGGREAVFAAIWLAGVLAVWGFGIFSTFCFRRRLRFAIRTEDRIYESDAIASSCIAGVLRPRIYLISGLAGEARGYVLCHEREHIRHGDQLWNVFAYAVMGIHWFNLPLWALYGVFGRELEQCCDERVIRRIGEDQKENYCETLLAMAVRQSRTAFASPAFGKNRGKHDMKKRIDRILWYRQPEKKTQAAAFAAAVVLGAGLLCQGVTGPAVKAETEIGEGMETEEHLTEEMGTEERLTEDGLVQNIQTEEMVTEKMTELAPELLQLAEELYAKRNPYVGDAPADGALLELLRPYLPDTKITMELETDERPYTLRLKLNDGPEPMTGGGAAQQPEPDQESGSGMAQTAGQDTAADSEAGASSPSDDSLQFPTLYADLYRPAGVFLALIGNLDAVVFEYPCTDDAGVLSEYFADQEAGDGVQSMITEYYDADWFAGNEVTQEDLKTYGESAGSVEELLVLLGFNGTKPELYYEGDHSIAVIGGADGPTSIFLAGKLGGD